MAKSGNLTFGLNIQATANEINNDIPKVIALLKDLSLTASLNKDVTQINQDILDIETKINEIKLNASINNSSITAINNQINNLNNQINNIGQQNTNTNQTFQNVVNQAKNTVNQVTSIFKKLQVKDKFVSNGVYDEDTLLNEVRDYYQQPDFGSGKIAITNKAFDDEGLKRFAVKIEQLNQGLLETRTIWYDVKDEVFNFSKNRMYGSERNSVDIFNKALTDYQIKLSKFKSDFSRLDIDTSGFENVLTDFQNGIVTIDDLKLAFSSLQNKATDTLKNLNSTKSSLDPLQQTENSMRDFPTDIGKLNVALSQLKDQSKYTGSSIADLTQKYDDLNTIMMTNSGGKIPSSKTWTDDFKKLSAEITKAKGEIDLLHKQEKADNSTVKRQASYYTKIKDETKHLYDLKTKLLKAGKLETAELNKQIKNTNSRISYNNKQLAKHNLTDNTLTSQVNDLKNELENRLKIVDLKKADTDEEKRLAKAIDDGNKARAEAKRLTNISDKRENLLASMKAYEVSSTKLFSSTSKEAVKLKKEFEDLEIDVKDLNNIDISSFEKKFSTFKKHVDIAGLSGKKFTDVMKDAFTKFTQYYFAGGALVTMLRQMRLAMDELLDIDTILTEISKTSDRTNTSLARLGKTAFDTASKYGQTASDYLTGVQEMSRSGFDESQSEALAELSILAQSAGNMTADLANEYLIATNASYKLNGSLTELTKVLDGQNYITNRNAVNMQNLAEATKVTASQASSSGVEIDKMTSAIGTMMAVTQETGDVTGRAFKAILMNVSQVKGELDDGEIVDETSLSKYEEASNALGVSLKEVKNGVLSLRDPMKILEELAEAYTSLDKADVKRANLINAIGGKYRGNQLNALLENWEMYEKMLGEYSEGTGSALKEAMKSADSWQGLLNQIKNNWVAFTQTFAQDKLITGFLKIIIELTKGINNLVDFLGGAEPIILSIATALTIKKVAMETLITTNEKHTFSALKGAIAQATFGGAIKQTTKAMIAFYKTNPWGWILMGATALMGIVSLIKKYNVTLEEQREKTNKLKEEYNELKAEIDALNDELETTNLRISELSGKDKLTFVEKGELESLKESNVALQHRIDLLQEEADFKNKEHAKELAKTFEEDFGNRNPIVLESESKAFDELYEKIQNLKLEARDLSIQGLDTDGINTEIDEMQAKLVELNTKAGNSINSDFTGVQWIEELANKYNELNELKKQGVEINEEEFSTLREELVSASNSLDTYISEYEVDDDIKQSWVDLSDVVRRTLDPSRYVSDDFNKVFTSLSKDVQKDLKDLAVKGTLTELDLPQEFIDKLESIGLNAKEAVEQLLALNAIDFSAGIPKLQTYDSLIDKFSGNMGVLAEAQVELAESGKLSSETVSELIKAYPTLQHHLDLTEDGFVANKESLDDLINAQLKEYELAQKDALNACRNFVSFSYDQSVSLDEQTKAVKDLMYAKLKMYETERLLTGDTLSEVQNSRTYQNLLSAYTAITIAERNYKNASDVIGIIEKEIEEKEKGKSKGGSDSTSDFKENIDWMERSISSTERSVETLNNKLNDTTGYKNQIKVITKLKAEQEKLKGAYDSSATLYSGKYTDSLSKIENLGFNKDEIGKKIEDGSMNIEDFIALNVPSGDKSLQEQLYNAIEEAIGWFDKSVDMKDKSVEVGLDIVETNRSLDYDKPREQLDGKLSQLENQSSEVLNAISLAKSLENNGTKEQFKSLVQYADKKISLYNSMIDSIENELTSGTVELYSERWYELQEKLQDCNDSINDCKVSQSEWRLEILRLPTKKIDETIKALEKTNDSLDDSLSKYGSAISSATSVLEDEIDSINNKIKSTQEYYKSLTDPLQEQLNILEKSNNERSQSLAIQKSLYELERAKNQKTSKVYKRGQGFVYEANQRDIIDKQQSYDDAIYNKTVGDLQEQIKTYEEKRDNIVEGYETEITSLETIKKQYSEITGLFEKNQNLTMAKALFGDDFEQKVLAGNAGLISDINNSYVSISKEIKENEDKIGQQELLLQSINDVVLAFQNGELSIEEANKKINTMLGIETPKTTGYTKNVEDAQKDLTKTTTDGAENQSSAVETASSSISQSYSTLQESLSTTIGQINSILLSLASSANSVASSISSALSSAVSNMSKLQDLSSKADSLSSNVNNKSKSFIGGKIGSVDSKMEIRHDGMESGFIGSDKSSGNIKDIFELLSLKSNERLTKTLVGEAVLTEGQQANIVKNYLQMSHGNSIAFNKPPSDTSNKSLNFNGDIIVHEVSDKNFAREIKQNLPKELLKELYKK